MLLETLAAIGLFVVCISVSWHKAHFFLEMTGLSFIERRIGIILDSYLRGKRNSTKGLVCSLGSYTAALMIYLSMVVNPRVAEIVFDGSFVAISFVLSLLMISILCLVAAILSFIVESAQQVRELVNRDA